MALQPATPVTNTPKAATPATTPAVTKVEKVMDPKRLRDTVSPTIWSVVGLESCPWTEKAIELLKSRGDSYKFIPLNVEWQRRLLVEQGTRRIPGIFKGPSFIGGFDALENYYKCSFITDTESFA